MLHIELASKPFEPFASLQAFQRRSGFNAAACGANALFIGTMRDFNEGDSVVAMHLEHYPQMTEHQLSTLAQMVTEKWELDHVLLIHRVGDIVPSEAIVLVAVWSAHRQAAFNACRELMEALKHQAPFWKQEVLNNGARRWVKINTPDYP